MQRFLIVMVLSVLGFALGAFWPSISAAELFNRPSGHKSSGTSGTGRPTLYNATKPVPETRKSGLNAIDSTREENKKSAFNIPNQFNVKMRQQVNSAAWSLLDSASLKNRQADVDLALKIEYKNQIETEKLRRANEAAFMSQMQAAEREHEKRVAEYEAGRAKAEGNEESSTVAAQVSDSNTEKQGRVKLYNSPKSMYDRSVTGKKLYNTQD